MEIQGRENDRSMGFEKKYLKRKVYLEKKVIYWIELWKGYWINTTKGGIKHGIVLVKEDFDKLKDKLISTPEIERKKITSALIMSL